MRFQTPHHGPHEGKLCKVLEDGTLQPMGELEPGYRLPPILIPDVPGQGRDDVMREALDNMTGQLVEAGHSPSEARHIAQTAARRADGDHDGQVPYFPDNPQESRS